MALRPGSPGRDSSDSLIHRTCVVRFRADSHPLLKLNYFSPSFSKFQVFQFNLLDQSGTRKPSFLKPSPYLFNSIHLFLNHLHPTSSFQPFTTPTCAEIKCCHSSEQKGPASRLALSTGSEASELGRSCSHLALHEACHIHLEHQ